jgi:hypothetical protein
MKNLAIVLIVLGIIMITITGFNYVTREKVVDIGPVQVTTSRNNPVEWSPFVGGVALIAGVVLMISSKNKK